MLRGMKLRNTREVIGVVLYTGNETKLMMNNAKPVYKMSQIMWLMNNHLIMIFIIDFALAMFGSTIGTLWSVNNDDKAYYLGFNEGLNPA